MRPLITIVLFTPDMAPMQRFYEHALGLEPRERHAEWTSFRSGPVTLALHPDTDRHAREVALTFASTDLEADLRRLAPRGVRAPDGIERPRYGPLAHVRDPEGNLVTLHQLRPRKAGDTEPGQAITTVIVNGDTEALRAFYRDALGLAETWEAPGWIELDAGGVQVALHRAERRGERPLHAQQPVACCFDVPDVLAAADTLRARGVALASAPTDEEFGIYAELVDPDGNVVVLRQPHEAAPLEETLAEAWEDGTEVTHPTGVHRPATKGSKSMSRLILKPERRITRGAAARAKPKRVNPRVAIAHSTRGAGPDHTRLKPKNPRDVKRARAKPAVGRKQKKEIERSVEHKAALARASRTRPVKRAATPPRPRAKRGAPARGGAPRARSR
jgi:predicted enzyme related to lactoylglutathione lyase